MSVSDLDVPAELADLVLGQPPAVQPPRPHAGSTDLGRRPLGLGPDNENNRLVFPQTERFYNIKYWNITWWRNVMVTAGGRGWGWRWTCRCGWGTARAACWPPAAGPRHSAPGTGHPSSSARCRSRPRLRQYKLFQIIMIRNRVPEL